MLVEFWRGSYVPLSLLMTWWTDVPKRGEKEPTVFPSMVGMMLFTTFSGYVFPGTFTVSGLAGSMVIVQVLTQTSQEKEEIPPHPAFFFQWWHKPLELNSSSPEFPILLFPCSTPGPTVARSTSDLLHIFPFGSRAPLSPSPQT